MRNQVPAPAAKLCSVVPFLNTMGADVAGITCAMCVYLFLACLVPSSILRILVAHVWLIHIARIKR